MENVIEIRVEVIERKNKEKGTTFNTYRAIKKNGEYIDCRFVQDVKGIPSNDFIMVVDPAKTNVSKKGRFPQLWVKEVKEFKTMDEYYMHLNEENAKQVCEMFGE